MVVAGISRKIRVFFVCAMSTALMQNRSHSYAKAASEYFLRWGCFLHDRIELYTVAWYRESCFCIKLLSIYRSVTSKVHAGSCRVSEIHRTLTWTTGSLTCVGLRDHSYACLHTRGLGNDTDSESAQHFWLGKKLTHFSYAHDGVGTRVTDGCHRVSSPTFCFVIVNRLMLRHSRTYRPDITVMVDWALEISYRHHTTW